MTIKLTRIEQVQLALASAAEIQKRSIKEFGDIRMQIGVDGSLHISQNGSLIRYRDSYITISAPQVLDFVQYCKELLSPGEL